MQLFLVGNLQDKIHEANVTVHRSEAKYYDLIHPEIYSKREQNRLYSTLKMVDKLVACDQERTKKALDFGAGTGNLTGKLLQLGYKVTAIDGSAEMCKILEKKYKPYLESEQLVVVNSFIEDVPFDEGEFDLVTCYSVLHHLPDYIDAIQRLTVFLRNGGVMYLDHEVSPFYWMQESVTLAELVKILYSHFNRLINGLYLKISGINVPPINYELSDYWHNKDHHLDHEQIDRFFEANFSSFKRTDYHITKSWFLNPLFYVYKYSCKPGMSFWVAKK
ncbi:MAG: hypothetical protein CW691_06570 [Candidatus Bathyarchaeum sp.]|nr:MAG: hypothetical protein CW691_06570 [Candidatus Bathyarchaeum sp.]